MQAAEALGVEPSRLLKTLMVRAGGTVLCVLVPSDREVNLKRLAVLAGTKDASMLPPAEAERFIDRFLDQGPPGGLLHHRRRDIAGRDDAVLWRRRGVHHERFVEARDV